MIGVRVKQARLLAGLTQQQLADRLEERGYRVTKAAISKYENGKSMPPARFLLLASVALDVRSAYFTHQPAKTIEWQAFRRHSQLPQKEEEAVKAYARDIAELQIELKNLLYPKLEYALPFVAVGAADEAEAAAGQLRKQWDVGNRPLDNLVQMAEDRGVVVISWADTRGGFDGLSGWCGGHPVIVINPSRSADRIRFTLAHELGHLVMDTGAVSDKEEEGLAHRFAAALLAPAEHACHELGQKRHRLTWDELKMLKRKYGLSMGAWIRRAKDLSIISECHYAKLCKTLSARGWRKKEPVEYLGDEEPLQLWQMAQHAVAEGLMSPDRITRVGVECFDNAVDETKSEHLTVRDLLKMSEDQRNAVMERAFALAADDDFETFEAYEYYELEDIHDEAG